MKPIGLIGGTSWHSTVIYYKYINQLAEKQIGSLQNPPLLLYSINIEVMREGDKARIIQTYQEVAEKLQTAGAKAILICANTPHLVYEHIQPNLQIPILHIAEAIGKEAKAKKLQKIGLLGTKPTMTMDFIPSYLKNHFGIETILPESSRQEEIHRYISEELTQGKFTTAAKNFFQTEMEELANHNAEGMILGCTELPMLLEEKDFHLPLLDTTKLHAQLAVDFILGKG